VPDLAVLADAAAPDPARVVALHRARIAHLVVRLRDGDGVVGPLVLPGATACLRCADLHRRDADPRWPLLAAQLAAQEPPASGATVTCLLTAVTAAVQVLAWLDGSAAPVTLDATLELSPPDPVPRRRRWAVHPACGCRPPAGAGTRSRDVSAGPLDGIRAEQARMGS
jgi:bacteriocin biosynthesis cyclodehydratase domain-containing protein